MVSLALQITRGTICERQSLPNEESLCKLYSVCRITLRNALDELRGKAGLQTIEPAIATARIARHLQIREGTPVLRMVRTYFSRNETPLHLAVVHAHPEFYRYTVELTAR